MSEENKNYGNPEALAAAEQQSMTAYDPNVAYGFEETDSSDIVIPRVKVINALSPERQDGEADEGDVINSLTKEDIRGYHFIPIKQYYSCIRWNPDRDADPRMLCRSYDGRVGTDAEGSTILCKQCGLDQFDNTKTGKAAQPQCTRYLNFLGFFEENPMPVVLSFARTNYNEGRKMLSISKSMRAAIWAYSYMIDSRMVSKDRNKWYILVPTLSSKTSPEMQQLAFELFNTIQVSNIQVNYEDAGGYSNPTTDDQVASEI